MHSSLTAIYSSNHADLSLMFHFTTFILRAEFLPKDSQCSGTLPTYSRAPCVRERSPKAKKVWLSILVVTWPYIRPSVHTSFATVISMLWSTDSCQNRVFADQYHMTVLQVQFSTHQGYVFFWSYPQDQLQMDFFAVVTSLLLEVNYEFISGSFAVSLG